MSQIKPSILVNPNYATNGISSDKQQAGWYQVSPNSNNLALRVNYSNIGLAGEIQLNTTSGVFQGSNGSAWVNFNSTQGPSGPSGKDFTNAINFNNLGSNTATSTVVPLASVFSTTYANVSASISNVNIRSLQGGNYTINSNLSVNSMVLSQNSNVITMTSQPLPYTWDFTNGRNTVSYLKNASSDTLNYGWGQTSNWIVQNSVIILKGQAVRLTKDSSNNIVITSITYSTLVGANQFNTPFNILGIATQTVSGGNTCTVCTKGITSVLCTNTSNIPSGSNFSPSYDIPFVGSLGIVGKDGGIFCNVNNVPTTEYISAGYFLESGSGLATSGNYVLFYVNPEIRNF